MLKLVTNVHLVYSDVESPRAEKVMENVAKVNSGEVSIVVTKSS